MGNRLSSKHVLWVQRRFVSAFQRSVGDAVRVRGLGITTKARAGLQSRYKVCLVPEADWTLLFIAWYEGAVMGTRMSYLGTSRSHLCFLLMLFLHWPSACTKVVQSQVWNGRGESASPNLRSWFRKRWITPDEFGKESLPQADVFQICKSRSRVIVEDEYLDLGLVHCNKGVVGKTELCQKTKFLIYWTVN